MTLNEVYYQESYQVGDFLYRHYGARVSLNNGDTEDEAWDFAQKTTANRFIKDNPQIKWSDGESVIQVKKQPQPTENQSTEAKIIAQIYDTTEMDGAKGLESFKLLALNNKTIKAAYDMQELKLKKKTT